MSILQFKNGVTLGSAFIVAVVPTIVAYRSVGLDVSVTGEGDSPVVNLVEETCLNVRWHAALQDGSTHAVGSAVFPVGSRSSMLTTSAAYVEAAQEDPDFQELISRVVRRLYAYHAELRAGAAQAVDDGAEAISAVGFIPGITDAAPRTMSVEEINHKIEARCERLQGFLVDAGILGKFSIGVKEVEEQAAPARRTRGAPARKEVAGISPINDFDKLEAMLSKNGVAFDREMIKEAKKLPLA